MESYQTTLWFRGDCKNFGPCFHSLTDEVREQAKAWWGDQEGASIATFLPDYKPKCFEPKEEDDDNTE